MNIDVCADCLRRTDLLAALSGRIEVAWRLRTGRPQLLALADEGLLDWGADDDVRRRYEGFKADVAVDALLAAGLGAACRCSDTYPQALFDLADPPAILHVAGDAATLEGDAVAVVGARRASAYGHEVARSLGSGLARSGVTVVSGMAMGIDSTAHAAALAAGGRTVAVLATGADRPYPARSHQLRRRIAAHGCVVSELPPGTPPRRWAFPARNRLIAALSAGTVVVEGNERSGSLITADFAVELGRFVGAVPGPVTSPLSGGPHTLVRTGADLVRGAQDVVELLFGVGAADGRADAASDPATRRLVVVGAGGQAEPKASGHSGEAGGPSIDPPQPPADLPDRQRRVLAAVEQGRGSLAELAEDAEDAFTLSRDLGELELRGLIRRVFGGRYVRALS